LNASESQWVAVSGGLDLAPAGARAVSLAGLDVVIWRSQAGAVQAWENRCPHRGMRLSFGQVRADRLVCRYHGWAYDQAGRCQYIPASPKMAPPAAACVAAYACRETLGLIWVNRAGDEEADLENLARQSGFADSALFIKSIYVDGALEALAGFFEGNIVMPGVVRLAAETAGEDLLLILQQCAARRCAVHIIAPAGGDDDANAARRLHYGDWARRLRWRLANRREAAK
jgi:nitrite reductase/ring-hydroxylating ferredoxin subunit